MSEIKPHPRHGDERNRREETEYGREVEYVNQTSGKTVWTGPGSSHTYTVVEKYCGSCELWVEVKGVTGKISWIAEHDEHDADDPNADERNWIR